MCKRTIVTSCIKCLLIVIIGFAKNRLLMKLVPVKQVQGAYESTRKRGSVQRSAWHPEKGYGCDKAIGCWNKRLKKKSHELKM